MARIFRQDRTQEWNAAGVLVRDEPVQVDVTEEVNRAALSDRDVIIAKLADIKSFLTDPDVEFALNIGNSTPLSAQEQNALNKDMIRQLRKLTNLVKRLTVYVMGEEHPELLEDISDT